MSTVCADKTYIGGTNHALLDMLPPGRLRVLDCGCGAGDNARVLRERGCSVTGITVSPAEAELAAAHCERVLLADLEDGLPEGLVDFDLVLMSHVLEHLRRPEPLLHGARGVLRSGGQVAVALPNPLFYRYRLRFLRGRFDYEPSGVMDDSHVRFYTFDSGARLLTSNGFTITASRASGFVPMRYLRSVLPQRVSDGIADMACRQWPGLFGIQSLYLARPATT